MALRTGLSQYTLQCPRCAEQYRISLDDARREVWCGVCRFAFCPMEGARTEAPLLKRTESALKSSRELAYRTVPTQRGEVPLSVTAAATVWHAVVHVTRLLATCVMLLSLATMEAFGPFLMSPMIGIPLLIVLVVKFGFWWVLGTILATLGLVFVATWLAYD